MSFDRPPVSSSPLGEPLDAVPGSPADVGVPAYCVPARRRFQHRYKVHAAWFLATVAMTLLVGVEHYRVFLAEFSRSFPPLTFPVILGGFWYCGTILAILGAHEMGHYVMCRWHRVDATLPYFIPAPPPIMTGTFGAFIKIREGFPSKAALFDIGVGGPIAGFVVLVPALAIGLALSNVVKLPQNFAGFELGEPILFKLVSWLRFGPIPDGYSINLHPMAFAAWFGLLATALNLMPFGQLDGGHIAYAVLGRRATLVSLATISIAVGLTLSSMSWLFFTLLMLAMLFTIGARHPRVPDEHLPLDRVRLWIAFASLVIFILCFTPTPIELHQLISNP